jgi:hypothetical protein
MRLADEQSTIGLTHSSLTTLSQNFRRVLVRWNTIPNQNSQGDRERGRLNYQ